MDYFSWIQRPTLLLDERRAQGNLTRMLGRAAEWGVRYRPHFKTHQSALIGEWFREAGVRAITVSSLEMANYFAAAGWQDILVAFPVNLRERELIHDLTRRVHLELLVESREAAQGLEQTLDRRVDVWLKVDSGAGRTGLAWQDAPGVEALARAVRASRRLNLRGLLTHAGHTYAARGAEAIRAVYAESVVRMNALRDGLQQAGLGELEVSVGDTPGASVVEAPGRVEEIRPGNFIFYDVDQLLRGACAPEQIAVAVGCPVVALHPERREATLYGGAVHLSKDFVQDGERRVYGLAALPDGRGWSAPLPGAYLRGLSQEHGMLKVSGEEFNRLRVGDLVFVLPVHSCLTVAALGEYRTLDGERIETLVTHSKAETS